MEIPKGLELPRNLCYIAAIKGRHNASHNRTVLHKRATQPETEQQTQENQELTTEPYSAVHIRHYYRYYKGKDKVYENDKPPWTGQDAELYSAQNIRNYYRFYKGLNKVVENSPPPTGGKEIKKATG